MAIKNTKKRDSGRAKKDQNQEGNKIKYKCSICHVVFDIEFKLNSHINNYHHGGGLKDSKISSEKKSKNEMKRMIFKEKSNQRKSISNNSSQNNVAMDKKMPSVNKLSNKNSTPDNNSMKVSSMDKLPTKNATEAATNCM